jgi:anaphase-promoting complex subunit 2
MMLHFICKVNTDTCVLQGNRTLNWKPHLGSVNLDIELKDRKINLTVSPIHATIIWHFQTKSKSDL